MVVMSGTGQMLKLKGASIEIPLSAGKKTVGVAQEDLFAYPNPTSDVINFFLNGENSIKSVRFLDMSGREVARLNQVNAKSATLNVGNMANGLYIAEVLTDKGRIIKKIEVMR
ncbi:MAG: T9SS type A sorting domain-containing protein [Saprospiraceae bacterium]|nr:T9SS type A sorting domain-containing protein [Saprospiraceae bacterium]